MLISVIMPSYNTGEFVLEALESIFSQSGTGFEVEVIFVDDSSTDHTLELVTEAYGDDKRFKLIQGDEHLGVSKARNIALDQAAGEYVIFCDADDMIASNAFDALYTTLNLTMEKEGRRPDLIVGRMCQFHDYGSNLLAPTDRLAGTDGPIDPLEEDLFRTMMVSAKMYRSEFLRENHLRFDRINYSEDALFWMQCVYTASLIVGCNGSKGDQIIYRYRKRSFLQSRSITQRYTDSLWKDMVYSNQTIEACMPDYVSQEYRVHFKCRTAQNMLRGFWRNYWLCDGNLKQDMCDAFTKYIYEINDNELWLQTVINEPADQFLGLTANSATNIDEKNGTGNAVISGPYTLERDTQGRITEVGYALGIRLAPSLSGEALIWVLNSVYRQTFPSFCVSVNAAQYEELSDTIYDTMMNLYVRKSDTDCFVRGGYLVNADTAVAVKIQYVLDICVAIGPLNSAVSRLISQQSKTPGCIGANVLDARMKNIPLRLANKLRVYGCKIIKGRYKKVVRLHKRFGLSDVLWNCQCYEQYMNGEHRQNIKLPYMADSKAAFILKD